MSKVSFLPSKPFLFCWNFSLNSTRALPLPEGGNFIFFYLSTSFLLENSIKIKEYSHAVIDCPYLCVMKFPNLLNSKIFVNVSPSLFLFLLRFLLLSPPLSFSFSFFFSDSDIRGLFQHFSFSGNCSSRCKDNKKDTTFQGIRPREKEGGTGERDIHFIDKIDVSDIHVNTAPPKRTISSV